MIICKMYIYKMIDWSFTILLICIDNWLCLLCFIEISDYSDKVEKMKMLVNSMPTANHNTMRHMFRHLKR